MAKRRNNGEGTLTKRASGNWRATVTINGKRHSFTGKSKAESLTWIRETATKTVQGYDIEAGKVSLSIFIGNWLSQIKTSRSPGTLEVYRGALSPLIESLGNYPIKDIRPDMIQAFYDSQIAAGRSAHNVKTTHKALHVAFEHAVKLKVILSNPVASTIPPLHKTREMAFYDDNQVQTLLLTAQDIGDRYFPLYYLAIHTGMRQAELLGLRWTDLNWEKQTLLVQRQLLYCKGGGFEYRLPKTTSGRRSISLGHPTIEILKAHEETQWNLQQAKGEAWDDHGLIFPSTVGTPVQSSNLRRSFRKLFKASGLPKIRFHDLRHTAASLMLNYGIPLLVVSERLGHSKPSITLDIYGHLIPSQQVEAARLMDELMTPVSLPITPELHRNDQISLS